MKNFFKNKITLWVSLVLFLINTIFFFGYGVMGFGTWRYSFAFFEVSKSFHSAYASVFLIVHLVLAFVGLLVFIISLVYWLKDGIYS